MFAHVCVYVCVCVRAFLLYFSGVIMSVERGGLCAEGWIDAQHY